MKSMNEATSAFFGSLWPFLTLNFLFVTSVQRSDDQRIDLRVVWIVTMLFIINHAFCRGLNITQFAKELREVLQLYPEYDSRDIPIKRNLHLPENDCGTENEEYSNLCETETHFVQFEDSMYDYDPPFYREVFCKSYPMDENEAKLWRPSQQQCVKPEFHCVQRHRNIHGAKRRKNTGLWQPYTKEHVASGCDCMWPSRLGDIRPHY